jgi:hypothetical protein
MRLARYGVLAQAAVVAVRESQAIVETAIIVVQNDRNESRLTSLLLQSLLTDLFSIRMRKVRSSS